MSVQPYFQAAAAELRKAIAERKHEIDQTKKEMAEREAAARRYIDNLKRDQQQKEMASGNSGIDNQQRIALQQQAKQDLAEITNQEQAIRNHRDYLQQQIANLERDIMDLERKANELQTRQ